MALSSPAPVKFACFGNRKLPLAYRRSILCMSTPPGSVSMQGKVSATPLLWEKDELVTISNKPEVASPSQHGLGIVEFLKNKIILITGATGFFGKVLVEKILREQPNVGKIYVLVNAASDEKAQQRLQNDILDSSLFQVLRSKYGDEYSRFMSEKLVAIPGRVEENNLGVDERTRKELCSKLDIVVNSAATTNFFERYDVALAINTKGPLNILEFAKKCSQLQLFLHVSTAYVNGTRQGRVMEAPFCMGQSIAQERYGNEAPPLDVWKEIKSVSGLNASAEYLKDLGMYRARQHGWQDTYVFTKAMGEMLINHARGDIPVVILRPSVVESTLEQPFAGWIQGTRMMDPIVLACGRGHLKAFYGDPNGVLDVVPADMVANSLLAAMTCHAGQQGLNIYQVGSSVVNPLTFNRLKACSLDHFKSQPFIDKTQNRPVVVEDFTIYTNKLAFSLHKFLNYDLLIQLAKLLGRKDLQAYAKAIALLSQRVEQLLDTYSSYTFYKGRFDVSNTQKLYEKMSDEEQKRFGFDIGSINWDEYLTHVHLPGLRKYNNGASNSTFRLLSMMELVHQVVKGGKTRS